MTACVRKNCLCLEIMMKIAQCLISPRPTTLRNITSAHPSGHGSNVSSFDSSGFYLIAIIRDEIENVSITRNSTEDRKLSQRFLVILKNYKP